MFMDCLEAPGSRAPFPLAVDSGKDTSTISRGPSVAGTNTGSLTLRPCESALTLCTPLSSTRRERFKDDTISGPSSASFTILEGQRGEPPPEQEATDWRKARTTTAGAGRGPTLNNRA